MIWWILAPLLIPALLVVSALYVLTGWWMTRKRKGLAGPQEQI